ncbi:MAG: DUF4115 domain-containing protein [Bacillota bacterium]|nr:DUF4115 domain-containing protein [Bacillota bacterium]
MKKVAIVILILVATLLLAGCGQRTVEAPAENDVPEAVEPEKREPLILDAEVPERDPFNDSADSSDWETEAGDVDIDGRNPFVAAAAKTEWEPGDKQAVRAGRDPFDSTGEVVIEPEPVDPVEPGDPTEPTEPGEPGEPGDVPVPDAVVVQVTTLDRCWLDVFVDGERVLRTNVPRGETLSWEGSDVLLDQVGRDYAVNLVVNGKDLGLLEAFVLGMTDGVYVDREIRIRIELAERYTGGVLVGLRFRVLESD